MRSSRARRIGLLVVLAILIAAIGLPWLWLQEAAREREQRAAERAANQALWEKQGLQRYALTIDEDDCQYVAEVRGDISAIDISQANCTLQPTSVEALFRLLERDGQVEQLCDTRGCPCESAVSARGSYDASRGYPRRIVVNADLRPAWLQPDFWRHLAANQGLPPCMSRSTTVISVIALEPR